MAQEVIDGAPVAEDRKPKLGDPTPSLFGRHMWKTEEGSVVVEARGDTVFVAESLDQDTTQKLEQEMFPTEAAKK